MVNLKIWLLIIITLRTLRFTYGDTIIVFQLALRIHNGKRIIILSFKRTTDTYKIWHFVSSLFRLNNDALISGNSAVSWWTLIVTVIKAKRGAAPSTLMFLSDRVLWGWRRRQMSSLIQQWTCTPTQYRIYTLLLCESTSSPVVLFVSCFVVLLVSLLCLLSLLSLVFWIQN